MGLVTFQVYTDAVMVLEIGITCSSSHVPKLGDEGVEFLRVDYVWDGLDALGESLGFEGWLHDDVLC